MAHGPRRQRPVVHDHAAVAALALVTLGGGLVGQLLLELVGLLGE